MRSAQAAAADETAKARRLQEESVAAIAAARTAESHASAVRAKFEEKFNALQGALRASE